MAGYPVYDSDGNLLGNYAWKDIPRLFKDRWYLEKGIFHLKPATDNDTENTSEDTSNINRQSLQPRRSEEAKNADGNATKPQITSDIVMDDSPVVRFEDDKGRLLGYFRYSDIEPSVLVHSRYISGKNIVGKQGLKVKPRMPFLKASLSLSYLTEAQKNEVLGEMGRIGPIKRVEMQNGALVGFFSEGEVLRRWTPLTIYDRWIVIEDALTDEQRTDILRKQLSSSKLSRKQASEIRILLGVQPTLRVWDAPQQSTKPSNKAKESTDTGKVQVTTSGGAVLGTVKRASIIKRQGKWSNDFYTYDGKRVILAPGVSIPAFKQNGLMTALDKAHEGYRSNTRNQAKNARKKATQAKEVSTKQKRLERRQQIIERCLKDRSPECQDYVIGLMMPKESRGVSEIVEIEKKAHPELYEEVQSYEQIKLSSLVLANVYEREHSDNTEDLLEQAHLFLFDDEAWWEAKKCHDPLTHLPYAVCLVEDVLIWDIGDGIKSRAVSPNAKEVESKRMLSFVVNRCTSHERSDGTIAYSKPLKALPGSITVSSIRKPGTSGNGNYTQRTSGRSPRVHTRRGFWRNQAYGPGMKLHKRIWISSTIVSPSGKSYRINAPTRVHLVTIANAE